MGRKMYKDVIYIDAFDKAGNTFTKDVKAISLRGKPLIDFGFPVRYYVEDILPDYPLDKDLCIDAMGRNHKDSSVYVKAEDVNAILERFGFVDPE